jgi:hypothetical protein
MPNSKASGAAYSDPEFDSLRVKSGGTVGFFGVADATQPALSAMPAVATTAVINSSISSSCFGFTSAQATAIITLANGLRAALVTLGLGAT